MPRRRKLTSPPPNTGHFQQGADDRRDSRCASVPSAIAGQLDLRFPETVAESRRMIRDLVRRNGGLSAIGKLCARSAVVWAQVSLTRLSEGDDTAAAKASRLSETFLDRVNGEIAKAKKKGQLAHAGSDSKKAENVDGFEGDTAEARALLARVSPTGGTLQ